MIIKKIILNNQCNVLYIYPEKSELLINDESYQFYNMPFTVELIVNLFSDFHEEFFNKIKYFLDDYVNRDEEEYIDIYSFEDEILSLVEDKNAENDLNNIFKSYYEKQLLINKIQNKKMFISEK